MSTALLALAAVSGAVATVAIAAADINLAVISMGGFAVLIGASGLTTNNR